MQFSIELIAEYCRSEFGVDYISPEKSIAVIGALPVFNNFTLRIA